MYPNIDMVPVTGKNLKTITDYNGKVYCVTVPTGNIIVRRNGKVTVCGNCSMVGAELFQYLESQLEAHPEDIKVLFVGDPLQLPPVGESISPTFEVPEFKSELTTVVRQALDNPIINMTVQIREAIRNLNDDLIDFEDNQHDGKGISIYKKPKQFRSAIFEKVDHAEGEVDNYKVISSGIGLEFGFIIMMGKNTNNTF